MSHLDPDLLRVGDVLQLSNLGGRLAYLSNRQLTLLPANGRNQDSNLVFMAKVDNVVGLLSVWRDSFKIGWLAAAKLLVESEELDTAAVDVANLLKGL